MIPCIGNQEAQHPRNIYIFGLVGGVGSDGRDIFPEKQNGSAPMPSYIKCMFSANTLNEACSLVDSNGIHIHNSGFGTARREEDGLILPRDQDDRK